ncbi:MULTISPECIES: hypothetical protein [Pseudomonas]|uniref:hypothetical protein n=1 Tax=Pseudomonas TaxID=286 RepID=UPI0006B912CA|nr:MULTISPECIES: hypothetical protein [Pseudomonas]KPB59926.1 Uncharacterized protein AC510_0684 [Pseudomonas amygdali pv. myricae]MCF5164795.1 hypothetical protein [Pseudomonas congelans]RMT45397.1 hypothetical protein ALP46_200002 [Pseudomonas amygdali pv. myricae]RMU96726.1 hypothetical protein ALP18_200390 [Pseudomonas amygdali pv. myricae]RMV33314.1 hypothetical protein ALP14_01042 [Pseudomonas amygdali pv. myricae]
MTGMQISDSINTAAVPAQVVAASKINWGVPIDAYLMDAARVGDRYAAEAFLDRSGRVSDGMTVATPPVITLMHKDRFKLVRSECHKDHYVIVTEQT